MMIYLIRLIQRTYKLVEPTEGQTVLRNAALLSGLQAITYLLPVLLLPYLFQVIGPERFGLIAFAQAFAQYFLILTDYGFSVSATQQISLHRENLTISNTIVSAVMSLKVLFLVISGSLLLLITNLIPRFHDEPLIYLLSFMLVIGSTLFPTWFFQGTERMSYIVKLNIIGELLYAFGIVYFVRSPDDYLMVPAITGSVAIINGLFAQYLMFKHFGLTFRFPSSEQFIGQLRNGLNVFISILAINAYTNTRIFAVGLLTNNATTGFYSIAERIANCVQTFPLSSFTQAIFPRITKIYQKNASTAYQLMSQIQLITVLLALIFIPITFIFAPLIVNLVCDGNYPQAVLSLRFLLIAVFFVSANAFRVQYLLVSGNSKTYSRIHVRMAIIGLPLIIILIMHYSYMGAAIATAIIEASIWLVTFIAVRRLGYQRI